MPFRLSRPILITVFTLLILTLAACGDSVSSTQPSPATTSSSDHDRVQAHLDTARQLNDERRSEDALAELNAAISLNAQSPEIYEERGHTYNLLDELDLALADFDRAIELGLAQPSTYFARGYASMFLGRLEDALSDFDKVVKLAPDFSGGYEGKALVYTFMGRDSDAESEYNQAIELGADRDQLIGLMESAKAQR